MNNDRMKDEVVKVDKVVKRSRWIAKHMADSKTHGGEQFRKLSHFNFISFLITLSSVYFATTLDPPLTYTLTYISIK